MTTMVVTEQIVRRNRRPGASDVVIHGAGTHVHGRHHVEKAVRQDGLTWTYIEIPELFAADEGVIVYSTQHLRHDTTGAPIGLSALKMVVPAVSVRSGSAPSSGRRHPGATGDRRRTARRSGRHWVPRYLIRPP